MPPNPAPSLADSIATLPQQSTRLFADLVHWLRTDSLEAAIATGVGVALFFVLLSARGLARRSLGRDLHRGEWRWVAARLLDRVRAWFLAIASAKLVASLSTPPPGWGAAIAFLFTVAAAIQGALLLRAFLVALVERRAAAHTEDAADNTLDSAVGVLRVLITVAVWAVVLILLLDNLGVNVTALVAGLGIGGIAIGLAAQGIFADLFAALAILLDRPFRRHDTISFGPPNAATIGTVEAIGLKTTRLKAPTGEEVIVGNTKLLADQIRNLRRIEARTVTMALLLDLAAEPAQLAQAPALLQAAVEDHAGAAFVRAAVHNATATAFETELVFTLTDPDYANMMRAREAILLGALRRLHGAGLRLARAVP